MYWYVKISGYITNVKISGYITKLLAVKRYRKWTTVSLASIHDVQYTSSE